MKKINLLLVFLFIMGTTATVYGQKGKKLPVKADNIVAPATHKKVFIGNEPHVGVLAESANGDLYQQYQGVENLGKEIWMGFSSYDLQSNGVNKHRVHSNLGRTAATWTFHESNVDASTTFPTRGSGYNFLQNGSPAMSAPFPTSRLEDRRVGWGNIVILDSGRELVISHGPNAAATANDIVITTKDPGSDFGATTIIPSTQSLLWPHVDTDGSTIHVVCITTPTGNGGVEYQGMNGALLYFRSTDGGETWDVSDFLLPEVNSSNFTGFSGDGYSLDVEGDHVVIVNYDEVFGDIDVWTSNDAGTTWSGPRKAMENPIDQYVVNSGYTIDDIGGADPLGPAGTGDGVTIDTAATAAALLAIRQCDGTGNAAIEADGTVHVVFPRMYLADADTTDAGWSFFPFTNGLFYWNSNMNDNEPTVISSTEESVDVNGNDTLDYTDFALFATYGGTSTTSAPSIFVTDDGIITISYTQIMENLIRPGIDGDPFYPDAQHYSHLYLTAAHKSLMNWQTSYDVINSDVMIVASLVPTTEASFPHLYNDGSHDSHMTFQWDDEPGMFVYNENDEANDQITGNTQSYWGFNVLEIFPNVLDGVSTEDIVNVDAFKLTLNPNPADNAVRLNYELTSSARSTITVSSIIGQRMMTIDNGLRSAGTHTSDLDVSQLTPGVYIVNFRSDNKIATQKLVVE